MARKKASELADEVENEVENSNPTSFLEKYSEDDLIPTGITLLDCALTENLKGGFCKGKINTIPGKSGSGKTLFALNHYAAVANDPRFDDYDLIIDDAENALEFDIREIFGDKLANRIRPPKMTKQGRPIYSSTIQEFRNNILKKVQEGKPFIWTLDSLDSVSSDEEVEREYKEAIRAAKSDEHLKELKQSYNTEKAKILGQILRMIVSDISESKSMVNIIQQTRQKLNAGPFEEKEITSGGNAPFFYSSIQTWLSVIKSYKENKYKIPDGQRVKIKIKKNKLIGKKREIEFDIMNSIGIDNLGANFDWMLDTDLWKKDGRKVVVPELDLKMEYNDLLDYILANDLEPEIDKIVLAAWLRIEDEIKIIRKKRWS